MKKHLTVVVLFCLLGATQVAQGAMMGFTFSGTITGMSEVYGDPNAFNGIGVGSGFTGGFIYDLNANAAFDFSNNTPPAKVFHADSYWLNFGDFIIIAGTLAGSLTNVDVVMTDSSQDSFRAIDWTPFCSDNSSILFDEVMLKLVDPTGTVLAGPELPAASQLPYFTQGTVDLWSFPLYELPGWQSNLFSTADIHGSIDSLSAQTVPVPEPATFVLVSLGLAVLAMVSRKRLLNRV